MYLDVTQALPDIAPDLARVEARLLQEVDSDLAFITEVASHLITAGGKRIRPSLTLACAGVAGLPAPETSIMGGVSVELVHLGSLHHDDVMDKAATRRNVASVNEQWDDTTAVLSGDFLLARASVLAAQVGTDFSELLAATIAELCEGQIREHQDAYNCDRTIASYEKSISGKTASLLATSCRVGATTARLSADEIAAVTEFGRSYGMTFQILDDINDFTSSRSELGKPSGQDILEGNYTLPALITLASPAGDELRELLSGTGEGKRTDESAGELCPANLERALELVRSGEGIQAALDAARNWAGRALSALDNLRDNPHTQQLRHAAQNLASSMLAAGLETAARP